MARREFGIASRGSPSVIYPVILNWLAVRGVHGERQAIKESASGFALCKTDDYGAALLAYFQGDADEEAVLSATASDDGDIRNKRLCEASYYMGMRHLLAAEAGGPQAEQELSFAFQYLQRCLDTGVKGYNEYLFARLELKRLRRN